MPEPRRRLHLAAAALVLAAAAHFLGPMVARWDTYGFHDWDVAAAYRHITTLSLLRYGELPYWHPYLCGGFPALGYVEGAPNLVSPYLPVYLLFEVPVALRLEVIGTTLTAALGAYLLAGRFTSSVALRTIVAILFALNGRWGLQAATGHGWHLQYCYLPFAVLAFEVAVTERRLRPALLGAIPLALMVWTGGIYPVPHTALYLVVLALLRSCGIALLDRDPGGGRRAAFPLLAVATQGALAIGLAAPKLFAALDGLARAPRLVASPEVIGVGQLLVMLTDRRQAYGVFPVAVPAYNWHEWGLYVGWAGAALLAVGLVTAPVMVVLRRDRGALGPASHAGAGLAFLLLGLGAFHPLAPWALLHRLPPFSSQHVPSRFHLVMVLALALAAVAALEPLMVAASRRLRHADALLLLPVALIAWDVTTVARRPFAQSFWMEAPAVRWKTVFEQRRDPAVTYRRQDWARPVLLPMRANRGVVRCYGVPATHRTGAVGADEVAYRGEVWVAEGPGEARRTGWTPNSVSVAVPGAEAGTLVVINTSYDPSWNASVGTVVNRGDALAVRLPAGAEAVVVRYRPRTLLWSSVVFLGALLALGLGLTGWRWRPSVPARHERPGPRSGTPSRPSRRGPAGS